MDKNEEDQVLFADPTDLTERTSIATSCVVDLGIEFPALVDPIDNRTELAYTAWPERIYLVGADGRIILKTKPGPFGFEPDELEAELEKLFPDVPELPEEDEDDDEDEEAEEDKDDEEGSGESSSALTPPLLR